MKTGERIKQRRDELHLKRDDLATAVGVSYSQMFRYENGDNQPTAEIIVALARTLRVSTDWLLGTTELTGMDTLTDTEREALALLRTKSPEGQRAMVELMRAALKL